MIQLHVAYFRLQENKPWKQQISKEANITKFFIIETKQSQKPKQSYSTHYITTPKMSFIGTQTQLRHIYSQELHAPNPFNFYSSSKVYSSPQLNPWSLRALWILNAQQPPKSEIFFSCLLCQEIRLFSKSHCNPLLIYSDHLPPLSYPKIPIVELLKVAHKWIRMLLL